MPDYAFNIGQRVYYRPSARISAARRGVYEITQRMPPEGGELRYRIKNPNEDHERVVNESELRDVRAS
jgi:hypothetical protein